METFSAKQEKEPVHPDYQKVWSEIRNQVIPIVNAERTKKQQVQGSKSRNLKDDSAFLGSGSNAEAYAVDVNNIAGVAKVGLFGRQYAPGPLAGVLMSARGIPHTPQLIAYSNEDNGVMVMTRCPGMDLQAYRDNHVPVPEYSDEQIRELLNTAIMLANRGIAIDPKPSNFLYDPKEGFSIIDFNHRKDDEAPTSHDQEFRWVAGALEHFVPRPGQRESMSEAEQIVESYKDDLKMRLQFMRVVQNHFPQIQQEWKKNQGTEKGFLCEALKDLPDHPELNAMYAELEALGVAWDVPPTDFEKILFKTTREKGVAGIIAERRESEQKQREETAKQEELAKGYQALRFESGSWFFPDGRLAAPDFSIGPEEYHRELFIEYERSFGRGKAKDVTHAQLGSVFPVAYKEAIKAYQPISSKAPSLMNMGSREQVQRAIQEIKDFRRKFYWLYDDVKKETEPKKTFRIRNEE